MIQYIDADETMKLRIAREWGDKAARHMHLIDGLSIVVFDGEKLIGLISTYWKKLPTPLDDSDAYIDILEVHKDYRRQGIAHRLIEISMERAKQKGIWQIRAWSS